MAVEFALPTSPHRFHLCGATRKVCEKRCRDRLTRAYTCICRLCGISYLLANDSTACCGSGLRCGSCAPGASARTKLWHNHQTHLSNIVPTAPTASYRPCNICHTGRHLLPAGSYQQRQLPVETSAGGNIQSAAALLHRLHVRTRHAQRRWLQWKLNNVNK